MASDVGEAGLVRQELASDDSGGIVDLVANVSYDSIYFHYPSNYLIRGTFFLVL